MTTLKDKIDNIQKHGAVASTLMDMIEISMSSHPQYEDADSLRAALQAKALEGIAALKSPRQRRLEEELAWEIVHGEVTR